jgi:hypothetical protein
VQPDRYGGAGDALHVSNKVALRTPDSPMAASAAASHRGARRSEIGVWAGLERSSCPAGVPVTAVYLPQTDHAFDLLGTAWSSPARTAIHVLERFLAVLAATDRRSAAQPISGSPAEPALPGARSL